MSALEEIQEPVRENLAYFNRYLKECVSTDRAFVGDILEHVLRNQGKQMRPLLVFLVSGLYGGVTPKTYVSAMLIELVHTASLVHDDVVDEAFQRRGDFSVRALWRSRVAVLIGDYIFSRGLRIAVEREAYDILGLVSHTMEQMSRGELIQSEIAHKFRTTETDYYEIIHCKTATLLGSCARAGALSAGADAEGAALMRRFGEYLGLAFQIKDDILDYLPAGLSGKTACNDLKEQKMTLPLIRVMETASPARRREITYHLRRVDRDARAHVAWLCDCVTRNGGLEYAAERMKEYRDRAVELLRSYPDSVFRRGLERFADYVLERKK